MTITDELDAAQLRYLQLLTDAGCKIKFKTYLPRTFGTPKPYVCMTHPDGTHFFERIPEDFA